MPYGIMVTHNMVNGDMYILFVVLLLEYLLISDYYFQLSKYTFGPLTFTKYVLVLLCL